jgi:hypothetical protein
MGIQGPRAPGTNYELVDAEITCVLTRFRLRSCLLLPLFYFRYRRIYLETESAVTGFLQGAFFLESPYSCCTFSLWRNDKALADFGNLIPSHVGIANWSIQRLLWKQGRPDIWSSQWRLRAIGNRVSWKGVDLRTILTEELNGNAPKGP